MRLLRGLPALLVVLLATAPASAATNPPSPRIVGGTLATQPWPAQAFVDIRLGADSFMCGGTLVTPRHVVTAAHCVTDDAGIPVPPSAVTLVLGHADLGEPIPPADRYVPDGVTVHPSYDAQSLAHDVAVLRLARPAAQAPLPIIGVDETDRWAPGTMATIVGWGLTSTDGSVSSELREAQVPIVGDAACDADYAAFGGIDATTMVCAGDGTSDACQGDSGGPLMATRADSSWALVGMPSWGTDCADASFPGVYTRLGAPALNAWLRTYVRTAEVTASARTPQPGETVSFSGWATSADGTVGTLAWDLDDDGSFTDATGPAATASFAAPGRHRVRASAADSAGNTVVGATTVTVLQTGTPTQDPSRGVAPVPPRPRAAGTVGTVPPTRLAALRSKGLKVRFTCAARCAIKPRLTLGAKAARRHGLTKGRKAVTIGTGGAFLPAAGEYSVTVRLTARAKKALRRAKRLSATLTARISGGGLTDVTVTQTVTVRR
jgi:secreted trypsin-like serine protease